MSWRMARNSILAVCAAGAAMVMSGCGSSSANVVTVSVTPSAVTVVAGQVQNFTATVGDDGPESGPDKSGAVHFGCDS